MKKHYYIKRGRIRPSEFTKKLTANLGITRDDYNNGKWIEISKKQFDFCLKNPNSTFPEIAACEKENVAIPEISIEEKYKNRVVELISARYSQNDEIAILFSEDEYRINEHNLFVEAAKSQAKQELGIDE